MFGWKLFRALLCIQIINLVSAEGDKKLPNCATETCSSFTTSFCIDTDSKIFPSDSNCKGSNALTGTVHIFKYTSDTSIVEINSSTDAISSSDIENLILYICDDTNCSQTVGYVKLKTYSGDVLNNETAPNDFTTLGKYCSIDSGVCKLTTENITFGANKFYATADAYIAITKEGGASAGAGVTCSTSEIGSFSSTHGVCLESVNAAIGTAGEFLLTGSLNGGSIFSYPDGKNNIMIKATTTEVYHNNLVSAAAPVVFIKSTMKAANLSSDNTSNATNLAMFICENGSCQQVKGYAADSTGVYSISTSESSNISNGLTAVTDCKGHLGELTSDKKLCTSESTPETNAISTAGGYFIINKEGFKLYNHKTANFIIISSITVETGINVVNVDTGEIVGLPLDTNAVAAIKSLALFNCNQLKCEQTVGMVKSNDSKYYNIFKDISYNEVVTASTCGSSGMVGGLSTNSNICISKGSSDTETDATIADWTNGEYLLSGGAGAFTTYTSNLIIVKTSENYIYYENLNEEDILIFKKGVKLTAVTETGIADTKVYTCGNDGICTAAIGFATDGTKFYKLNSLDSSEVQTLQTSCSGNSGGLLTGGKLCKSESDHDAVAFSSSDTTNYYMTSDFKLVTAKKNLFVIGSTAITSATAGSNIVNLKTSELINPSSAAVDQTQLDNIAIFQCATINSKSICERTYGFVKDKDSKYYAIGVDRNEEVVSTSFVTTCSDTTIGKIKSDGKFCLGSTLEGALGASGTAAEYIISNSSGTIFAKTTTTSDSILIISTANTHVYNNIVDTSTYGISLFASNSKIATSAITNTNKAILSLYSCNSEGKCKGITGIVKNNSDYYSIEENKSELMTDSMFATDCSSDESIGKLEKTNKKLCIGKGKSVALPSDNASNSYVLNVKNTVSKRSLEKRKASESDNKNSESSSYKLFRTTASIIAINNFTDTIENDINAVILDTAEVKKLSELNAAAINKVLSNLSLFDCDTTKKECHQTYGYIKSSDDVYYKISAASNALVNVSSNSCDTVGSLVTLSGNIRLCLSSGDTTGGTMEANKKYLLTGAFDTTYTGSDGQSTDNIIIKATANSLTLDIIGNGYSVITAANHIIANEIDTTTLTNNGIYKCTDANICTAVKGYIISGTTYFKVNSNSVSAVTTVTSINDVSGANEYCASNIGDIFTFNSKNYLCLDKKVHIELNSANYGQYILGGSLSTSSPPLTAQKFIKYEEKYITVDTDFAANDGNTVVKVGDKYYIYNNASQTFTAPSTAVGIGAYELISGSNIYQTPTALKNDPNIYLFYCDANNICTKTVGYILVDSTIYKNGDNTQNNWSSVTTENQIRCSAITDAGNVGKDANNSKLQVCTKNDQNAAVFIDIKNTNDYLITDKNNNYKMYIGNDSSASTIIGNPRSVDGFYLIKNDYTIIKTAITGDTLVRCTNNVCTKQIPEVGYYPEYSTNFVIKCDYNSANPPVIQCALEAGVEGYYVDNSSTQNIIKCESVNGVKKCTNPAHGAKNDNTIKHFIEAKPIESANSSHISVITCTIEKCVIEDRSLKGYFVNSGSDNNTNPVIKCSGTTCSLDPGVTTASNIGDILVTKDTPTGAIITLSLCLDGSSCTGDKAVNFKIGNSADQYVTLKKDNNSFPGVGSKDISVKIGKDGSAILLEDAGLTVCGTTCKNGVYCLINSGNKIQTAKSATDSTCADVPTTATLLLLDKENKNISNPSTNSVISMAYKCKFDDNSVPSCKLVKGYIKSGTTIIQCTGWKRETCHIVESTTTAEKNGGLDSNNKINFIKHTITLPTDDSTNYIAMKTTTINTIYGLDAEQYIFLALNKEGAIVSEESIAKGYHINANSKGTSLDDALINCQTENSLSSCTILNPTSVGYYLDASSFIKIGQEVAYTTLIKCNDNDCEWITNPNEGYYINAIPDSVSSLKSALIECSEQDQNISCKLVEEAASNEIYINNYDNNIIQCSTSGCSGIPSTSSILGTSDIPFYFISSNRLNISNMLIKCTGKGTCHEIEATDNSVYLNGNLKINNINNLGETDKPLIVCTKEDEITTCSTIKDTISENEGFNYYINSGEYKVGTTIYPLIKCTGTGCQAEKITEINDKVKDIFYINSNYDTTGQFRDTENYLIHCISTSYCELYSNGQTNIEHYIHGDLDSTDRTKMAIIECEITIIEMETTSAVYDDDDDTDDSTIAAECKVLSTSIKNGSTTNIYIDASEENHENIIRCINSSTTKSCTSVKNDSKSNYSSYYLNEETSGLTTNLIKCTASNGCVVVEFDDSEEPTEDIPSEEKINAESEYKVFLNANYKEKVDEINPLIKCGPDNDEDSIKELRKREISGSISCKLDTSKATAKVPEYYINADTNDEGKDYDGETRSEVIRCIKKESTSDKIKFNCNTSQNINNNDVFLNGNYDESNKQLIKCSNTEGCVEADAYEESQSGFIYYVNSGATTPKSITNTLIKCTSSENACEIFDKAKNNDIYINSINNQLITCKTDSGCKNKDSKAKTTENEYYLNSSDIINKSTQPLISDLIKCYVETKIEEEGEDKITKEFTVCKPEDGEAGKVYINADNIAQVIYCLPGTECAVKNSTAEINRPQYFVNGDTVDFISTTTIDIIERKKRESIDSHPLENDLIECINNNNVITCRKANGKNGDVFINGNYEKGKIDEQLIKCSDIEGREGCLTYKIEDGEVSLEILPAYFVNTGNRAASRLDDALIKCGKAGEACEIIKANATDIYFNSNENNLKKTPIIKCNKNGCNASVSAATKESKAYYLNAGNTGDYDIIECGLSTNTITENDYDIAIRSLNEDTTICTCKKASEIGVGVYLNSNYAESGDNYQLIQCKDGGCEGLKSKSTSKDMEYYVNAESSELSNAIIFCSNKKCEKITPDHVPMYYVGVDDNDSLNGLIECVKMEVTQEAEDKDEIVDEVEIEDEIVTRRRKRGSQIINRCILTSAMDSQGYYLNSGYNKSTNQTIICNSNEGCQTIKVDLGYYVNAGNPEKPIIKCEKENAECTEELSPKCPSTEVIPGNYCLENNNLKFYPNSNSTGIYASKSDDIYTFASIPNQGFPGIRSNTSTLFKVSRFFINRFYQSGVIMLDKNGKLVNNLNSDQSDISLYDCNESTKICNERPGCTHNTYMFDSENKKAILCNNGKMEYAQFTGYVIDNNRVTGGSKHPYIIKCKNNGEKCTSIKPKISTYYENSGYDYSTNSLIYCNNNDCITVAAEVGYYVGRGDDGISGIIKCTSSTSCTYNQVKTKVKYVNAGSDKMNYGIIECNKNTGCYVAKAKIGYYLTHSSNLLIQCNSPSSCTEFTPTVNYYDNADSSESNSSIINCVQNSQVITCAAEATNNGFYMSSQPNVLIRCKAGSKCKTITVKNGIFRGAIKGLTGGSKRSSEEDKSVFRKRDVHNEDEDFERESDSSITMPRDSDEAYGIIRCIAGKCSALSVSEVAAIPMCEFNNNKCYITLEYSMTKSATTSISAGNICTNSDRSVFYFATDTIVVKPNVISGVTATYVYTTTNSNCLEVNDSYTDMYFTVGSNIFLLDQGSVLQFYESGYYFINTARNVIVSGNDIDEYNDENVKLYKCNGNSCSIVDKPESMTYYADVNKRILKYNVNSDAYSFAYTKDIICIFANNKCTPNADLKNQEFCITYKGELVLAKQDIKNRETGECYKANSITSNIYGYSQYLYQMNLYSAQMVDETGYYIVSLSTNTTVVSKNYKIKNSGLIMYGCQLSLCKVYEPEESTYYYDANAKIILRYKDGAWYSPSTSGYAYISVDPTSSYIYRFTKTMDEIKINAIANYGYYYTVDQEMYHCERDEDGTCTLIDNSGYYFTNAGEIYYCIYDSENLEPTECTKQACVSGQYYYIDEAYYRCESSSTLVPVVSRYCSYNENVVVNFPLAFTEEFPEKIKQAIEGIEKNNNSTAMINHRGKNYLKSVSSIFTNCTYNVEETKSTFDLVCVNNYVKMDEENNKVKICSPEQLGYVECIEDEENPDKCKVSGNLSRVLRPSVLTLLIVATIVIFFN